MWFRRQKIDLVKPEESEASTALKKATKAVSEARDQQDEVRETSSKLRRIRERNNFAEMIREAIGDR